MTTLCQAVWTVERELDLLSWQIDGAHPWPIIRMRIFHELTRRSGLHGDPHPVRRTRADQARAGGADDEPVRIAVGCGRLRAIYLGALSGLSVMRPSS